MKVWKLLCVICFSGQASAEVLPKPSEAFLYDLKGSMVKINTTTKTGGHGFGTGVAISQEQVVTNCHVLGYANGVYITKWGTEYPAESVQADWKHDVCILRVKYADLKPVALGDSNQLKYEQPIISISMPNDSPAPYVALNTIKAMYPFDGEAVIRSDAAFSIGASGSPVFDYAGQLIGISTFKSPGKQAFYYNMPVNMVKAAMQLPAVALQDAHDSPFWDTPEEKRPYFMRIVLPYQYKRWPEVEAIAMAWVTQEPSSAEAWYYRGEAARYLNDVATASMHYQRALSLHPNHPASLQASAKLAIKQGDLAMAEKINVTLQAINPELIEADLWDEAGATQSP